MKLAELVAPADEAPSAAADARKLAEAARDAVAAAAVATAEEADRMVAGVRAIRAEHDKIVALRDAVTKPLRKIANAQAKMWKPALDAFDEAMRIGREMITNFETAKIATAQKTLEGAVAPEQIAEAVAVMTPRAAGSHQTTRWHAEVVDFAALPDEYKLPNMPALNKAAVAAKETFAVPGAKAVRVVDTVIKR